MIEGEGPPEGRRSVLVTHADQPIGRRLVKTLYHDDDVERILAVGEGPPPQSFDRFLGGRVSYERVDLTRHRPVADLFHSARLREAEVDTVVHLPSHGPPAALDLPIVAGVAHRTAEARLVLQHCLEVLSIRNVIALGSAFVYRLAPGNANRLTEESELDLDPKVPADLRSWIDCDMIFHGEVHNERLRVALLRVPTVVSAGGTVFLSPSLASASNGPRVRPLGFDPICALVSDKDVARAIRLAVHRQAAGIFNIASHEVLPLSQLAQWTGRPSTPVPGPLLASVARGARFFGWERIGDNLDGPHLRYGFTLDTSRAERELGFRPGYRISLARAGDGSVQLETSPA
jgi:nucleoside-diphosphate-sugar epimerase